MKVRKIKKKEEPVVGDDSFSMKIEVVCHGITYTADTEKVSTKHFASMPNAGKYLGSVVLEQLRKRIGRRTK